MATFAQQPASVADPLDVSRPELYRDDTWHAPFREIRAKGGIHYTEQSDFGAYWSIATYKPIVEIESLPDIYSSADGITVADLMPDDVRMPMFIAMDRPKHTGQRRTVRPRLHAFRDDPDVDRYPPPHRRIARRTAGRRGVRLGRQRVDRADHAGCSRCCSTFRGRSAASSPSGPTGRVISKWRRTRRRSRSGSAICGNAPAPSPSCGTARSARSRPPTSSR